MMKPKLDNFKRALKTLDEAMVRPPANELERDGIIQRFEYCIELSWNSAKRVLEYQEIRVDTPRNVFREMAKIGWIKNPEEWINYLDARNKTSHLYHEEVAKELFALVPKLQVACHELLKILEEKLK